MFYALTDALNLIRKCNIKLIYGIVKKVMFNVKSTLIYRRIY